MDFEKTLIQILSFGYVLDVLPLAPHPTPPPPGMDTRTRARCGGVKANPTRYQWCKYECFLTSGFEDMDF